MQSYDCYLLSITVLNHYYGLCVCVEAGTVFHITDPPVKESADVELADLEHPGSH